MSRFVRYHNDGSVRMDWYTFRSMKVDKIMGTVEANARVKSPHVKHASKGDGVREYV